MANVPSVPEIITVNSEALQTQVRDLLPSQNGFGSELQASNVITPIIDLTATAEGTGLRQDLQTALAFGSQTVFAAENNTVALASSPGFYRVVGTASVTAGSGAATFAMTDGLSTKSVITYRSIGSDDDNEFFDLTFWLEPGITLNATSNSTNVSMRGSIRQVADSQGQFVNPSGYPL